MTEPLKVLDLFSGIGGFSLGLERTGGFKTIAFCEIDSYCQRILKKHWPTVPQIGDVRDVYRFAHEYEPCECCGEEPWCERHGEHFGDCACIGCSQWDDEWPAVDVVCGGFPCQDISLIGEQAGISGDRSALWGEMWRIVQHLRPRWVIVENVSALLGRDIGRVLGDLAEIGYDAEWDCIPAYSVGAPHRRDRVFIVGYPNDARLQRHTGDGDTVRLSEPPGYARTASVRAREERRQIGSQQWAAEPSVGRVAYGIPARILQRQIHGLGNSIVPQIATWIGERILEAEHGTR